MITSSVRDRFIALFATASLLSSVLLFTSPSSVFGATVSEHNWTMTYIATDGDGISITSANYEGVRVFARMTLPYVFITYSETDACCTDHLGNSVRASGPTKTSFATHFRIESTYCFGDGDCSDGFVYKYTERYLFYNDGRIQVILSVHGPGLYPTATYEVFWRIDFDITDSVNDDFRQFRDGAWATRTTEATFCDDGANSANGYEWRQQDWSPTRSYSVDPYSYTDPYCDLAVLYQAGENGAPQGPHKPYPTSYDDNQSISDADVVQWWWGIRDYTRPSGCSGNGSGCTTSYSLFFDAEASGY